MPKRILRNRFALLLAQKAEREGRAKIPREEVAEATGIGISTLNRYANNLVTRYDDNIILALCDYLDCEPGDLLVRVEVDSTPEMETALLSA